MAPRRKTRSITNANESPSKALRKKAVRDDTNIEEWVYRFLGNLAAIEKDKEETKQRNMTLKTTDRSQSLKAARLRLRSPTPYAWSPLRHHPVDSDDFNFDEEEDGALITPMSKARTRVSKALTVDGPDVVHRDATLLQKINRYIRAGIAEGKRRAKRYVRKALSFAIETGYLVPADRDGKLLRVSPALVAAGKTLVDARGRRPRRQRSGRAGRVRRRASGRRKTTKITRRRSASDGTKNVPAPAPDVNNSQGNVVSTSVKRKRSEAPNDSMSTGREQPDKPSGESRKSSGRPSSSSHSSPSRRSHQRPIEDLVSLIPRAESTEMDRKPLSARSRPSSFARRSRDDDHLLI